LGKDSVVPQHSVEIASKIGLVVSQVESAGLPCWKEVHGDPITYLELGDGLPYSKDFASSIGRWNFAVHIPSGKISPLDPIPVIERNGTDRDQAFIRLEIRLGRCHLGYLN
jgi:hypothetical protein